MDFSITLGKLNELMEQDTELSKSQVAELFIALIDEIQGETESLVNDTIEDTREEIQASVSNVRTEVNDDIEEVRLSIRDIVKDFGDLDGEVLTLSDKVEIIQGEIAGIEK